MDDQTFQRIQNDPFIRVMNQVCSIPDAPSAVLIAHGFLELLVNAVIDAKCKNAKKITDNHRDYSHSVKLLLFHELNLIPDEMNKRLEWFRKLRNRAAHEPFFEVKVSDLDWANEEARDPRQIGRLIMTVIAWFWNTHLDTLLPIFAPALHASPDSGTDPNTGAS